MTTSDTSQVREQPRSRALKVLRQRIEDGSWASGDLLPSEYDLVEQLQVSRTTVRVALKQLEREGLLQTARGRGRVIAGSRRANVGLMSQVFAVMTGLDGRPEDYRCRGYEKAVEAGMMDAIQGVHHHTLTLYLPSMTDDVIQRLAADRPKGILVDHATGATERGKAILERLAAEGFAVVVHGDGPGLDRYDRVVSDHESGSYQLARWLAQNGHKRILRVWSELTESAYWIRARNAGYEHAMREAGLSQLPPMLMRNLTDRTNRGDMQDRELFGVRARQYAGFMAEHVLGPAPVDAVMAMTDADAYAVAAACRLLGREPNKDIAIVGYDNSWFEYMEGQWEKAHPLATIEKHNDEIGRKMVHVMMDRLEGRLPAGPQRVVVAPELVMVKS